MSLVTRCPACATAFRVVPDQLKIANGWVRCGRCQHIFDATLDLQPLPEPAPAAAALHEAAVPAPADPPAPVEEPPAPVEEPPAPEPAQPAPADEPLDPGERGLASAAAPAAEEPWPLSTEEPAFVREARRRAFWSRPAVRFALAFSALILGLLLLGQIAWVGRDAWASAYPVTRPWLVAMCQALGCTLEPPRRLRDLAIDGSVLLRRAPDRYSFHIVIRNQSDVELATPALELTLTDADGQVLVRRVWLPQEWPQATATLAGHAEWPLQFELVFEHPQPTRMAGYRAALFYP
jgi:predicted Zn finger-like uncharacterized protein